ncbi:MAG: 4Fe-4S dicluster domain-containing protein [Deltaproteobacteria bacterium]|nr:4Fe-4S dicluster domain-containing protein [Deltaproteobacteria bacterium]
MKKRYVMLMDMAKCVGCSACAIACKAENATPEGASRNWIVEETEGAYPDLRMTIRSERCHHCSDAPCVEACPTGASHYGPGGTVMIDKDLCTGCRVCMASCPYGARYVHPEGHVDKCTFCMHRVEKGLDPACVTNCPTHSLHFGDVNEPESEVATLLRVRDHEVLHAEVGTRPNLYFLTDDRSSRRSA